LPVGFGGGVKAAKFELQMPQRRVNIHSLLAGLDASLQLLDTLLELPLHVEERSALTTLGEGFFASSLTLSSHRAR
jgi:hypothetical protein